MTRSILVYGAVAGLIAILGILATIVVFPDHNSVWLGYLVMLVALSSILLAIKQDRDTTGGGVTTFKRGFLIGFGIALLSGVVYAIVWEGYLAATGYRFMDDYTADMLSGMRAKGVSEAAYAKAAAEMAEMREAYKNPFYRFGTTFVEIFPVGLLVTLVSAALLKNPRFLPARARSA